MGAFLHEFIQKHLDIGGGFLLGCAVKEQGYIPSDKTAGGQGRASRTGADSIVISCRSERCFRGIGAFDSLHHRFLDAGSDSRPSPGEGSQMVLI